MAAARLLLSDVRVLAGLTPPIVCRWYHLRQRAPDDPGRQADAASGLGTDRTHVRGTLAAGEDAVCRGIKKLTGRRTADLRFQGTPYSFFVDHLPSAGPLGTQAATALWPGG